MKRRIGIITFLLALVFGICPCIAFAADGTGLAAAEADATAVHAQSAGAHVFDKLTITGKTTKTYQLHCGYNAIPLATSKAGVASMNIALSGMKGEVKVILYDSDVSTFPWAKADVNTLMAAALRSNGTVPGEFGGDKPKVGVLLIAVDWDADKDSTVIAKLTTSFSPLTKVRAVKSGEKVSVVQAKGTLYWPLTLAKASKVTVSELGLSGTVVCDSKKKVLSTDGNLAYVLGKGKYFIRTKVTSSGATKGSFTYKATKLGVTVGGNTTFAKAKSISLNKKVTDANATAPSTKARYYKIKLNKTSNVSVAYNTPSSAIDALEIYNSSKKRVAYDNYVLEGSGTCQFATKGKNAVGTKAKVKLAKGTYYIKVKMGKPITAGVYSFTVK